MPPGRSTPDDAERRRRLRQVARRLHPDVGGDPARYVEAVAAVEAEWARRGGGRHGPRPSPPLHPVEVRRAAAWVRALRRVHRQVRRWRRERWLTVRRRQVRSALRGITGRRPPRRGAAR